MKILRWEKASDLCAESGWHGYYLHLDTAMGPKEIEALSAHGRLTWLRGLKQPFYRLQADGFLLRGNQGDCFLKIGVAPEKYGSMKELVSVLEAVLQTG